MSETMILDKIVNKIKILVIENNLGDARLIYELIKENDPENYEIYHNIKLESGLEKLRNDIFDAVLLDLNLPDSSGIETLERTLKVSADIPIIVVSHTIDEDYSKIAVKMGAQDYLIKGEFDSRLLKHVIHSAIERKKLVIELKARGEKLKISEENFRVMFEFAGVGIAQVSKKGEFLLVNEKFSELTGYPGSELVGINFNKISHPKDFKHNLDQLKLLLEGKIKTFSSEKRCIRKDSSVGWVSLIVTLVKNSDGEPQYFICIMKDISERKEMERLLWEAAQRLSTIYRESPNVIVISKLEDDSYIDVNLAFEKTFGFSRDEAVGKTSKELGIFADAAFRLKLIDNIKKQGFSRNFDLSFRTKAGKIIHGLMSSTLISIDDKPHVLSVITDITDHKKAIELLRQYADDLRNHQIQLEKKAKELKELNLNLKELNVSKDKFFSILQHDLRTPFSSILGVSDFLAKEADSLSPEEIKEFARDIFNTLSNLFKIIENLLDWSALQTGRLECKPNYFDLAALFNEIIDIYHLNASQKNLKLITELPERLEVYADRNMIENVIRNLLSNALKFTLKGEIKLHARKTKNMVEVEISDSGVGLSKEQIDELLTPGKKNNRNTGIERNSGLGLVLCKEFIEKNGGKMSIKSSKEKGSRFSFTVPCKSES